MSSLNTESIDLFGVPFKHLNCAQRLDLYRVLQFDDELIDELEITFAAPEDTVDMISRQEYGVPYDHLGLQAKKERY